ncbi:MAG: hypothetical protein IJ787_05815 [Bacilli bacterium]|nr:hypothetical protein [Bacilli bacterium]
MKSIRSLVLAASSILLLASCGGNSSTPAGDSKDSASVAPGASSIAPEASSATPESAKLTAVYGATSYRFMSAYPGYTFKQVTFLAEKIELYSDNTYVFTMDAKNLSGALTFDPEDSGDQNAVCNDRGQTVTAYYGTYSATEEEGIITVTCAAPNKGYTLATGNVTSGAGTLEGASKVKGFELSVDAETRAFDYLAPEADGEDKLGVPTDLVAYGSGSYRFMSAYPGYTFKQVTGITETVVLGKDKTYTLTVMSKNLSGALTFDPEDSGDQNAVCNDRGASYLVYYGSYTEETEEGIKTLNLAAPSKGYSLTVGNATQGTGYFEIPSEGHALPTEGTELSVDVETLSFDFVAIQ